MVAGVSAQRRERLFHVEVFPLGHHALGLFDDYAAVEGVLELLVHPLGLERGAVLEDGDGGHIGQGLGGFDVRPTHLAWLDLEQVERPDDRAPPAQGQRLDRTEAGGQRLGGEQGPTTGHLGQVMVHHRPAATVALQAGPFPGLQLEQL